MSSKSFCASGRIDEFRVAGSDFAEVGVADRGGLDEVDGTVKQILECELEAHVAPKSSAPVLRGELNEEVVVTAFWVEVAASAGAEEFKAAHPMLSADGLDLREKMGR
jgi:hypothetical protein